MDNEIRSTVSGLAEDYTEQFEALSQRLNGQPLEVIKPEIQRTFQQNGGSITDPELSDYATLIRDGGTIKFTSGLSEIS